VKSVAADRDTASEVSPWQYVAKRGVHRAHRGKNCAPYLIGRILEGPRDERGVRPLVGPLLGRRLQRGDAGRVVVILDGPLGQQGTRRLVGPLVGQSPERDLARW
jgi:hypothetical protein